MNAQLASEIEAYDRLAEPIGIACLTMAGRGIAALAAARRSLSISGESLKPEGRQLLDDFETLFASAESVVTHSRKKLAQAASDLRGAA